VHCIVGLCLFAPIPDTAPQRPQLVPELGPFLLGLPRGKPPPPGTPISASTIYLSRMRKTAFEPCIPTRGTKVPAGSDWFREINHDGYRLVIHREGKRVCASLAAP
jgi:ATP-dependent DNA ligase